MYPEDTEGILRHWVTVVSVEGRDGMRQAAAGRGHGHRSRDTIRRLPLTAADSGDKGDSTKLTSSE